MKIDQRAGPHGAETTYTHGTNNDEPTGKDTRFGSAMRDGRLCLYYWKKCHLNGPMFGSETLVQLPTTKHASYRKAQRKLRQWLKGYNV